VLLHNIHELPVADIYRWSWGRWRGSDNCYRKCLKVTEQARWLLIQQGPISCALQRMMWLQEDW